MNKETAKQEVAKLVSKFSSISKSELDEMPEEQIKFRFIEPLFEALGWEREDIFKEKRILKGRADYILKIGNQDKLVVEAKKTNVKLCEDEGRQAVSYAYHKNIKFAALTNFKQIRVYHALSNIKSIDKNLLKDNKGYLWIDCEDFIEQFDRLWFLSRESFEKEEINKLLDNVNKKLIKPIDEAILTDLLQYREWLSKDLKEKRTYLTDPQIDEIVQILIDRLIFMRSVEDRGLEEKEFLLKKVDDVQKGRTDKNLWALLTIQFRIFDKEYNSKLFSEGLLEKEGFFDDKTLMKVIKGMYDGTQDHQERYMYDEIPIDLLGRIYEQYLGVVLRGTEKRVKLDLVSGKRKKMGIYYTPPYIVDYIVKNTIGEYIKGKTIDKILEIKILDPACGSGSFLIGAFQEVCNTIEDRLKKGEKSNKWISFNSYNNRLSLGQKATILTNCIFGVDLDEKAVELAQLNLLLKILEEETRETRRRILPNMKDNIINGNSLISDSHYDKAFNWRAQFPDVFRNGGFDIVVGNPPYGLVFDDKLKKLIEEQLPTFKRNNDLYVAFIEQGLKLLKNRGLFSYIIPNTYIRGDYFESLRKFIIDNSKILKIIDFGTNQIFKDPNVFNSIIILELENDEKSRNKSSVINLDVPFFENLQTLKIDEVSNKKEMEQSILSKLPWIPKNDLIEKINKNKDNLIDELCYVKDVGFNYWSIGRGKVRGDSIGSRVFYDGEKKSQKDIPYLKGRDIKKFNYIFGNHWLRNDYKKYLKNKVDIFRFSPKFLEISPKLIYRQTADRIIATIDTNKYYLDKTVHLIVPKANVDLDLYVLTGILNSKLMLYCYRNVAHEKGRTFAQVKTVYIKNLPIKIPDEKQAKKIKELVERIMQFYKEGKSEQQIKNVDYEIDEEIYKLYGITDKEKEVIEENLR